MGANSVIKELVKSSKFDWSFILSNSMVTTSLDGEFLHGLSVENTPYPNTVYVWNVTVPWFHPSGNRLLDFSSRLDGGSYFQGEPDQIVRRIVEVLDCDQEASRQILTGCTMQEFVKHHYRYAEFHEVHLPTIVFDMAAINALLGNTEIARRLFSSVAERTRDYPADDRLRSMTLACLDHLKAGKSIRPVLDPVAAENKANWRITPVKRPAEKGRRKPVSDGSV